MDEQGRQSSKYFGHTHFWKSTFASCVLPNVGNKRNLEQATHSIRATGRIVGSHSPTEIFLNEIWRKINSYGFFWQIRGSVMQAEKRQSRSQFKHGYNQNYVISSFQVSALCVSMGVGASREAHDGGANCKTTYRGTACHNLHARQ